MPHCTHLIDPLLVDLDGVRVDLEGLILQDAVNERTQHLS